MAFQYALNRVRLHGRDINKRIFQESNFTAKFSNNLIAFSFQIGETYNQLGDSGYARHDLKCSGLQNNSKSKRR